MLILLAIGWICVIMDTNANPSGFSRTLGDFLPLHLRDPTSADGNPSSQEVAGELEATSLGEEEDGGFTPTVGGTGLAPRDLRLLGRIPVALRNMPLFRWQCTRRPGWRNAQVRRLGLSEHSNTSLRCSWMG